MHPAQRLRERGRDGGRRLRPPAFDSDRPGLDEDAVFAASDTFQLTIDPVQDDDSLNDEFTLRLRSTESINTGGRFRGTVIDDDPLATAQPSVFPVDRATRILFGFPHHRRGHDRNGAERIPVAHHRMTTGDHRAGIACQRGDAGRRAGHRRRTAAQQASRRHAPLLNRPAPSARFHLIPRANEGYLEG